MHFSRIIIFFFLLASVHSFAQDTLFQTIESNYLQKEYTAAYNLSTEATQKFSRQNDSAATAIALQWAGKCQRRIKQFASADSLLHEALNLAADSCIQTAELWYLIGLNHSDASQPADAYAAFEESLTGFEICGWRDSLRTAQVCNNAGNRLANMGRLYAALDYHGRALEIREKTVPMNPAAVSRSLLNIGAIHELLGQYAEAERFARKALSSRRQHAETPWQVANALVNLGSVLFHRGELQAAEDSIALANTMYDRKQRRELRYFAQASHLLAQIALARGKTERAAQYLESALQASTQSYGAGHRSSLMLMLTEGDIALQQSAPEAALKAYRHVLRGFAEGKSEAQVLEAVDSLPSTEPWIMVALEKLGEAYEAVGQADSALSCYAAAFRHMENLRFSFGEGQVLNKGFLQQYFYPRVEKAIALAMAAGRPAQAFAFAEQARAGILLEALSDAYAHSGRVHAPAQLTLPLAEIQAQMPGDAGLLQYIWGAERVYVFGLTKSGLQVHSLLRTPALEDSLRMFAELIAHPAITSTKDPGLFPQLALETYQKLVAPVLQSDGAAIRELLIVPDGPLWKLPFELLCSAAMPDAKIAELRYLLRDYRIRYGFSATQLFQKPAAERPIPKSNWLGIAPDFGTGALHLCCNADEVQSIGDQVDGTFMTGAAVQADAIRMQAADFRVLHFATHALADTTDALNSRILLGTEGALPAREISEMKLGADLVVLSGCETGIGKLIEGEGAMSLGRAFIQAGARSTVMSLWPINDAMTAEFMELLYGHLGKRETVAEALRKTKLEWLDSRPPEQLAPWFWAGLVCVGQDVELEEMGDSGGLSLKFWLLLMGGLVILIAAIWSVRPGSKS